MSAVNSDVVASAFVKDGRLRFHNRQAFDEQVRRFRDGAEVEVAITIRRATRSQNQNAFWWAVCIQLASETTGYSPDEMHEIAKQMFIPKKLAVCNGNGEVVGEYVMGGSTRTMNTVEFGEFIERFRQWCAEALDLYIPDPSEHGYGAGV